MLKDFGQWMRSEMCSNRDRSPPTVSAFLKVVQGAFGETDIQSVRETIDLVAADMAPFEQHLLLLVSICS
jgi:hypothetical protein